MKQYVFQLWVTVGAENLDAATDHAHNISDHLEADPYIDNVLIGDDYEVVINEYGDTEPATD